MAQTDGGVLHYTKAATTVTVFFPKGFEDCRHCEFLRSDKMIGRGWCSLNKDRIIPLDWIDGNRAPFCPLEFENEKKE